MKWPEVLGQAIASRAIVDKIEIPKKYYDEVNETIDQFQSWANIFHSVETDKPHTWASAGIETVRKISKPMETDHDIGRDSPIRDFAAEHNLEHQDPSTEPIIKECVQSILHECECVLDEDAGLMMKYELDRAPHFYFLMQREGEHSSGEEDFDLYLPHDQQERHRVIQSLTDMFWDNHDIIKIGWHEQREYEYIDYQDVEFDGRQYQGELTEIYDRLQEYVDQDTRRCILFQGPPGSGKSTLAYNIAHRIPDRTMVFSHDFIGSVDENTWERMHHHLNPDMIFVDDIDRCAREMHDALQLFEDRHCDVPLIIFTSNHYDRLPNAFKRPGRVDEIIEMIEPPKEVRYDVIRSIGEQEGVDIPEDRIPILDHIYQEYPGAYIVELIRRCDVEGWDYELPEYGLTFDRLPDPILEAWNNNLDPEEIEVEHGTWDSKFQGTGGQKKDQNQGMPVEGFEF